MLNLFVLKLLNLFSDNYAVIKILKLIFLDAGFSGAYFLEKCKYFNFLSLSLLVFMAKPYAIFAAEQTTINIKAEFYGPTCEIAVNGDNSEGTVVMPDVSVQQLQQPGNNAGKTPFNIVMSNCNDSFNRASVYFESGANVDAGSGRLFSTGTASNIMVEIIDATTDRKINLGNILQIEENLSLENQLTMTFPFYAQYYATDAVTAGSIEAEVAFFVNYQ